jgi:hypothetical protein
VRARRWISYHSVQSHLIAPIWLRIPEKRRWAIVTRLDRSRHRCWSDLVMDALAEREDDACDVSTPQLRAGKTPPDCASVCSWYGAAGQHEGEHECGCYCGKFQFVAPDGIRDRAAA